MNCYQAKAGELAKQWYVIDANEAVVGRLAAQIAPILMGKHRPTYTPHIDTGDYVIVTNVDKVVFTGNKWQQKSYQRVLRPPRRPEGRTSLEAVPAPPGPDLEARHPADDAEEQDRPPHDEQAQALLRHGPRASGPVADPLGGDRRPTLGLRRDLRPQAGREGDQSRRKPEVVEAPRLPPAEPQLPPPASAHEAQLPPPVEAHEAPATERRPNRSPEPSQAGRWPHLDD